MKRIRLIFAFVSAALAAILIWGGNAQAAGWTQVSLLGSQEVDAVAVDPLDAGNVAAISGNVLWLSGDGGVTWRQQPFAGSPAAVAFDPVRPGKLAVAGSNMCLEESDDFGLTWQRYLPAGAASCDALNVVGTKYGFYFDATYVQGFISKLYRVDGGVVVLNNFPHSMPGALAYEDGRVCVGTSQEIFCSNDNGTNWEMTAPTNQIGSGVHDVVMHQGAVWAETDLGLVNNMAGVWQVQVKGQAYGGLPQRGLVVNGSQAIFGQNPGWSSGDVAVFTTAVTMQALNQHVFGLAGSGDELFAATGNGLYVTQDLVGSEAKIRRPVVIVPGIMGSMPSAHNLGALELDPILHTYDPLIARLRAVGYVDGQTLFTFPYDWRVDNEDNAPLLAEKLADVKRICGCSKVDVVAHSMGGLVARSYIEGSGYADDVNQLIEVGTPDSGSVNAYYMWEGGEFVGGDDIFGRMMTNLSSLTFHLEALSKGYVSFTQYVHEKVMSVQELLPNYSYISGRTYPMGYPQNSFLDSLDAPADIEQLHQRTKVRIIGSDSVATRSQLTLGDPGVLGWPDGQVISYGASPGDDTVPFQSLTSLSSADSIVPGRHLHLTSTGAPEIIKFLLGDYPDQGYLSTVPDHQQLQQSVQQADTLADTTSYQMFYALGQGKTLIMDSTGKTVGGDLDEIPDAYYSGDDQSDHLFSIPNPDPGNYHITFTAGDNETVTIGANNLDASDPNGLPAIQTTVTLSAGQSASLVFDPSTQALIAENQPASESGVDDSEQTAGKGGSNLASATPNQTTPKLSLPIDKIAALKVKPLAADDVARRSTTTQIPTSNRRLTSYDLSSSVNPLVADLSGPSWLMYGDEFWLALVVLVVNMVAFAVWVVQRKQ